ASASSRGTMTNAHANARASAVLLRCLEEAFMTDSRRAAFHRDRVGRRDVNVIGTAWNDASAGLGMPAGIDEKLRGRRKQTGARANSLLFARHVLSARQPKRAHESARGCYPSVRPRSTRSPA